MIKLKNILEGKVTYSAWKKPSTAQLKLEFKVEQQLKGGNYFQSEKSFLDAIKKAKTETITRGMDSQIGYRSGTRSKEELLRLIKSYASYPQYRNEKTLDGLYDAFESNKPMDMPIVLEFKNGQRRVFAGNTRMDVAFQLGINPKVLIVKADV